MTAAPDDAARPAGPRGAPRPAATPPGLAAPPRSTRPGRHRRGPGAAARPARRRSEPKAAQPVASELPVARVAVDSGLPHLDRSFDYAVPESLSEGAQPGCRVRVRFAGRQVPGIVLERAAESTAGRALAPLSALVSPEQVLSPEVAALARAVADRCAGSLYDVLRLALPPRHARVENEPPGEPPPPPDPPPAGTWARYPAGPAFLEALTAGQAPRAVWQALPGPSWPEQLAAAVRATLAGGRGALVVLPDARDVARLAAALGDLPHVALAADLGPAERYRRWLAVRRGQVKAVIGTRAATFAPVADLGLVAVWDDGDDLHAEPRAPYPHVRDVLVQRAHLAGAAALVGGHVRTAEAQLLVESGWARALEPDRTEVRRLAPHVARHLRRRPRPRPARPGGPAARGGVRGRPRLPPAGRAGARAGAATGLRPEPGLRPRRHPGPVHRLPRAAGQRRQHRGRRLPLVRPPGG